MIILGIDPGSLITGYGIIDITDKNHFRYLTSGCIRTQHDEMCQRLQQIFHSIREIMSQFPPNEIAIEQVFMHKNANSALKLGQARGAAIVAASLENLPVIEYSAKQIKQAIVGYGAADKHQIQHMVMRLLKLSDVPQSDAADALAVALCHAHTKHSLIAREKKT